MVIAHVRFPISDISKEAFDDRASESTHRYEKLDGLIRKYYFRSNDLSEVGGIYLWTDLDKASAWYNEEWYSAMKKSWGVEPTVEYLNCPIVVDTSRTVIDT